MPQNPTPLPGEQGQHYAFIRQSIAPCLVQSSPERRNALKHTPPQIPSWYAAAGEAQKQQLKTLLEARCESLNALEKSLDKLQSTQSFCQPLLEAALARAGHPLDVNRTWVRLYSAAEDAFGVSTGGFKVRTFSLLQAALNNFEAREAVAGYFNAASGFITEPDARGHFDRHATGLTLDTFAQLCRDLDLGAKYQAHLKALLYPAEAVAEGVWRERYLRYQKDAFLAAAFMALLKGDIGDSDHALLLRVAAGESSIKVGDKQLWYRTPCLMNLHLHDCLIIEPCVKYQYADWFIVYIPDDPDHPIKRYASFSEFQNELSRRLKQKTHDYAGFFSRFVAYKDRPYYFRRLTELVVDAPPQPFGAQWLRSEWGRLVTQLVAPRLTPLNRLLGDPQPQVRVPVGEPDFHINADALDGLWGEVDLWPTRFDNLRKRLLDDARAQAIPTADADASARERRLSHYLNIGLFGVNLLALVVPPLGAVMALVMVGQMLYEVLDGVVELGEGDREAGWAHISDVLENLAQLAAGAAVFHFSVSPFIESLKAVQLPSGKTRLWKPDLATYEHRSPQVTESLSDARGLQRVGEHDYLNLDGRRYRVSQDPQTLRYGIEHPTRPDAYRPQLVENGAGAWNHELERPLTWEGATLMRRLGPVMAGFTDAQLEQIRRVSGVEEAWLRRLHVEGEPVPAALLDTMRQFRAYDQARQVSQGIGEGGLSDALCSYAASLAVELPGWPAGRAIEAFAENDFRGASAKYGHAGAMGSHVLAVSRNELMTGQLPRRIIEFLEEAQIDHLLGRQTPRDQPSRIAALQKQLQARAQYCRSRIMRSLYASHQPSATAAETLVQRDFKGLPTLMVREMLAGLPVAEREALEQSTRIPLTVAQSARRLQQQYRLIQAYEGLYLEALANKDTEALVLNSLPNLPGWADSLRLEVREGGMEGELRAAFGEVDAAERKVLVRVAEGQYQAFDARGQELHGVNGLYGALQHALTDTHRQALGLPHVGQGEQLKAAIIARTLSREQLRTVLRMRPEGKPFFRWPQRLSDNRLGYPLSGHGSGAWREIIKQRVKTLYASMNEEQMEEYLRDRDLEDDRWLKALEAESKQLNSVLNRWFVEGPADVQTRQVRSAVRDLIRHAWARSGELDVDTQGVYRGQRIRLEDEALGEQLATLPPLPGNFDHVSSMHFPNSGLTDQSTGFLTAFRRLRILNLEGNALTRLPEVCASMPRMEGLDLSDNEIVLTQQTALHIREMRNLQWLALQGNPLSQPVDISRMPRLRWLYLSGCELQGWPVGIFAYDRPREFLLELTGNRLSSIPDVAPGSDRARVLARTAVTRDWLAPDVLAKLRLYLESVGLDPNRRFPPRGAQDSAHWMTGLSQQQWLDKQPVWNDLEEAPGSEAFFDELRRLSESADATNPDYQEGLTAKVWRMLEAMAEDAALRERLFRMAIAPSTCVDAVAELFNAMGLEVLLYEAQALPDANVMRLELLELAKGRARLDEVGRIVNRRVKELFDEGRRFPEYDEEGDLVTQYDADDNPLRSIDEVEIHLAFTTALADRLDLPWQSKSMKFEEPDVTPAMIDQAYQSIKSLDDGDGMRDAIADLGFWADYLQASFSDDFMRYSARSDALIDLQSAQRTLAADGKLSTEQRADLRTTIITSAQVLGKTQEQVPPGQVMSDAEYDVEIAGLGEERKGLLRRLTDQVMGRMVVAVPVQNRK